MIDEQLSTVVARGIGIDLRCVSATIGLIDNGATIPFISRYRKEMTGGLDEVQIGAIKESYDLIKELSRRKMIIISAIEAAGALTAELRARIDGSWNSVELEDIYLPYKPKRTTRAEIARRRGLEPLAKILMAQNGGDISVVRFVTGEVTSEDEALQGARDIVAQWICEDEAARSIVRGSFAATAQITAKVVKGKEDEKYRDFFDFSKPLKRCSSHQLLAMRRAQSEGVLHVSISPDAEGCIDRLLRRYVRSRGNASNHVREATEDAFKRLLKPSIENEVAGEAKQKADGEAIAVFTLNLRQLLLGAPLGQKRVMGVDPGFRSGCKIVCLDATGALIHNDVIYPHEPQNQWDRASGAIKELVRRYEIEAVAIGNGTANRETERFFRALELSDVPIFVVSENGASIYSASKVARDEFPDQDVTVRGAVSIGRRLMDPLSELVKIDAKSLGVGQYQHDVDQAALRHSLEATVESCVNMVGVNVNTASKHILSYISGVGPTLAQNIVDYRTTNGAFRSRADISKVARMGAKAFEQCAGFLRITGNDIKNPLDNSAVHPESYAIVERMAADLGCTVKELIDNKELQKRVDLPRYVTDKVGMPTLRDIMAELDKPGRDPRETLEVFEFDGSVGTIGDLRPGMMLPGIVSNITAFGCFVDIGIKENGLVHLSQMADKFVRSASDVVSLHQRVMVRVLEVDLARSRVALSMRD